MLTVKLIVIGKLKEKYLTEGCEEYIKRLGAYCKIQVIELAPAKLPENPSAGQIDAALEDEAKRILEKAEGSYLVSMCIEGGQLSSEELSAKISALTVGSVSSIAFVIGGSHGLAEQVKGRSGLRLSMSKMTFPHQLARMMLLEQLYRAFSIASGGKYHK